MSIHLRHHDLMIFAHMISSFINYVAQLYLTLFLHELRRNFQSNSTSTLFLHSFLTYVLLHSFFTWFLSVFFNETLETYKTKWIKKQLLFCSYFWFIQFLFHGNIFMLISKLMFLLLVVQVTCWVPLWKHSSFLQFILLGIIIVVSIQSTVTYNAVCICAVEWFGDFFGYHINWNCIHIQKLWSIICVEHNVIWYII